MNHTGLQSLPIHPAADATARTATAFQAHVRQAKGATAADQAMQARNAAQEFEAIFIAYLLKVMRDTIEESGLFEENPGKSVYTELFDQELARLMAQRGTLGVSELLERQLGGVSGDPALSAPAAEPEGEPRPGATQDAGLALPLTVGADADIPQFRMPVRAPVSSGYGYRTDPISRQTRFHKGLDLAAPEGTPVLAAMGGRVVYAGNQGGYGNTVVIAHEGGYRTRYAHLATLAVHQGDHIRAHQMLGAVGSTGRSTGPHLHFEITRSGERIDPRSAMTE